MKIFIAGATGAVDAGCIPVLTQIGHQVAADFLEKKVIWSCPRTYQTLKMS